MSGQSSLLPLPYPYVVPGGRFRELYYWDSYFTMLGLEADGRHDLALNMLKDFAFEIDCYGHVPNGNRTYYLSRSQPPFFSLMVDLIAKREGETSYVTYLPELEAEYEFWMDGSTVLRGSEGYRRVVRLRDGTILNRYWDDRAEPRDESYREDIATALGGRRDREISIATFERRPNRDGISAPDGSLMAIASARSGVRPYCRWISTVSWFAWSKPWPRHIGSRVMAIGHLTSRR
jgi:neutral trehalase